MLSQVRSHLTYANVIATLALFLALGGGAYAALKLPSNSVGSKQIKKNAVNSSKVANGSLLAGDFKAGQVPAGKPGPPGQPGTPGDPGSPGPPAKSFDGTVAQGGQNVVLESINGLQVRGSCPMTGHVIVTLHADPDSTRFTYSLYGNQDGSVFPDSGTGSLGLNFEGAGQAGFDAFAKNESVNSWTRIYAYGTVGTPCRFWGMKIPTS
jgi:hypothetical protein